MSTITITVVDQTGTNAVDFELPDNMLVQDFLPKILKEMDINDGPEGWALSQVVTSRILAPGQTLAGAGVGFGDKLRLVYTPKAA